MQAYAEYAASVAAEAKEQFLSKGNLWVDEDPERLARVRAGEIVTENAKAPDIPNGLAHHWIGAVFIPGVTMQQMLKADRDYDNQKIAYAPDVADSKLLSRNGNQYSIYLRLQKKAGITVVLDTWHDVAYLSPDPKRTFSYSVCRRVQQVENAGKSDEKLLPPGEGLGILWAMDSVWKLVERDNGLYAECTALTLTRDLPLGMARMLQPIIRSVSEGAIESTLASKRRSVGT
jgi:hypothetical protein